MTAIAGDIQVLKPYNTLDKQTSQIHNKNYWYIKKETNITVIYTKKME